MHLDESLARLFKYFMELIDFRLSVLMNTVGVHYKPFVVSSLRYNIMSNRLRETIVGPVFHEGSCSFSFPLKLHLSVIT